jgi:oxalate---CoA ligase
MLTGSCAACAAGWLEVACGLGPLHVRIPIPWIPLRTEVVPLTHGHLGVGALCVVSTLRLERSAVSLNLMPLFHLHGLAINILASAVAGASVICAPRFDAPLFFQWLRSAPPPPTPPAVAAPTAASALSATPAVEAVLQDSRPEDRLARGGGSGRPAPTWYSAVPTIHQEVARHAEHLSRSGTPPAHSLTLIRNCSAALPPSIGARLEKALPGVVVRSAHPSNPGHTLPTAAAPPPLTVAADPANLLAQGADHVRHD